MASKCQLLHHAFMPRQLLPLCCSPLSPLSLTLPTLPASSLTASGFSPEVASFLALRSFLIRASALRLRPRWNLHQCAQCVQADPAAWRGAVSWPIQFDVAAQLPGV